MADYSLPWFRALAAVLLALAPLAAGAQSDAAFTAEAEARVLALINAFRAEHGLNPVTRESRLDDAAGYYAGHMGRSGMLEHHADGTTPRQRVTNRGYSACSVSENIAYEYNSRGFSVDRLARGFVDNWRDSASHRANILDPTVTETGVGVFRSGRGAYYAAQVFAQPRIKGKPCRR